MKHKALWIGIAAITLGGGGAGAQTVGPIMGPKPAGSQPAPKTDPPKGDSGKSLTCSTGTVFAGNPTYDGSPGDRIAPGAPMKGPDKPFKWQNLTFVGSTLYSRDSGELWSVDTAAANPVMNRVAGKNPTGGNYAFTAGPCASARFGWIKGIAPMSDGSLLIVDGLANAILKVKNPTTPASCTVEYYAGTKTPAPEFTPGKSPNAGDKDGPGGEAKFGNAGPIVVDDAGNAYVYDFGGRKIKKVANDAAHTVSTLGGKKIDKPYAIRSLARIGSKLYGIGDDSSIASVIEIDSATGAVRTILEGKGDAFPPMPSYKGATLHGLTTDGTGLIISGMGYVWYLTTAGKLTHIAGDGTTSMDFPRSGYDPKASQPAMKLELPGARTSTSPDMEVGSMEFITYYKGAIYSRHNHGTGAWVERIACP
jgi:hypothetical protein